MSLMNFDELVPGATVRFTVIDGDQYLSVRDLIMVVCDKDGNHANEVWRNIPETRKNELNDFVVNFKFPGRGQQDQPVITFPGAMKLVMWLPGERAKNFRSKVTDILTRYFAGDVSLLREIEANAQSTSPVSVMARDSLGIKVSENKRRREELELEALENENRERNIKIQAMQQQGVLTFINTMQLLDPDWKKDTRLVIQTKDYFKNISLGQKLLTGGSPALTKDQDMPCYIQEVAKDLGYSNLSHGDSCKIGKTARRLYYEKHNKEPEKRLQYVDGAERMVNAYTQADKELLERAVLMIME